jgi:hypothetical protein
MSRSYSSSPPKRHHGCGTLSCSTIWTSKNIAQLIDRLLAVRVSLRELSELRVKLTVAQTANDLPALCATVSVHHSVDKSAPRDPTLIQVIFTDHRPQTTDPVENGCSAGPEGSSWWEV